MCEATGTTHFPYTFTMGSTENSFYDSFDFGLTGKYTQYCRDSGLRQKRSSSPEGRLANGKPFQSKPVSHTSQLLVYALQPPRERRDPKHQPSVTSSDYYFESVGEADIGFENYTQDIYKIIYLSPKIKSSYFRTVRGCVCVLDMCKTHS